MLLRSFALCVALAALPATGFCGAIQITYSLTQVTGAGTPPDTYMYTYSVFNDGSLPCNDPSLPCPEPLQLFDIDLDPSLYTSLAVVANTVDSQWSAQILQSAGSAPALFDAEDTNLGIMAGTSVSGFAVEFVYLGQGLPGPQAFQIYDPNPSFIGSPIQTGTTELAGSETTPEPATGFSLLGVAGVCGAWMFRRKISGSTRSGVQQSS